jgi:surfeit locus 1 family protein
MGIPHAPRLAVYWPSSWVPQHAIVFQKGFQLTERSRVPPVLHRFRFSWRISLLGAVLILVMLRLSYWQWERYIDKQGFLATLKKRVEMPISPLTSLLEEHQNDLSVLQHRRVLVDGVFDFEHEMVKRNRKDDLDGPGVHVVTPLRLAGKEDRHILVNRGYLPLSVKGREERATFQETTPVPFVALVKLSEEPRSFLAPNDPPTGEGKPWVDAWLRVDVEKIEKQLPYSLLPIHLEIISHPDAAAVEEAMVQNSNARTEIFYLGDDMNKVSSGALNPDRTYPVPSFSTIVPSATHLLYVFEWAFMALITLLVVVGLQLRNRPTFPLP